MKPGSSAVHDEPRPRRASAAGPAPTSTSPGPDSHRTGMCADSRPAGTAVSSVAPVITASRTPAPSAEKCWTSWRYRTKYRNIAYSDPFIPNAAIEPPTNVGLRNSARSNIGSRRACSTNGKATNNTPAATRHATTTPSPQPSLDGPDQPVHQRDQGHREPDGAEDVDPARVRRAPLGDARQRHADREHADRQVDEEDPAPAQPADEQAAERPGPARSTPRSRRPRCRTPARAPCRGRSGRAAPARSRRSSRRRRPARRGRAPASAATARRRTARSRR